MGLPSKRDSANAKPLNTPMLKWFDYYYSASPSDQMDPRINLVKADLHGLPPTTIFNAQIDPLRSDGETLADALRAAGDKVDQRTFAGVTHEFLAWGRSCAAPMTPRITASPSSRPLSRAEAHLQETRYEDDKIWRAAVARFRGACLRAADDPHRICRHGGGERPLRAASSQLVLESTQDPKLKSFARMMVADHSKSTAMVKAAAARSKVTAPPPKLTPLQTEMIAELRTETGPARDAAYVAQQKAAHGQALEVQKAYAMDGTAPALKGAAAGIVPVVEHHIEMLKTM